jgi:hypothetical protein
MSRRGPSEDARFEDGADAPLRLRALDADDLTVISSLVQDAVFTASAMRWDRRRRRFALLVNRFRWEEALRGRGEGGNERVQSVLVIEDTMAVRSLGITPGDGETVLSLLSLGFEPGTEGGGRVVLTLAGDGAVAVEVEALEVVLRDVTRPWASPAGRAPSHD